MQDHQFNSNVHYQDLHMGRYAVADVARWTGLSAGRIRRWLGTSPSYPPHLTIVNRHEETPDNQVSFLDIVELYMISELVSKGMDFKKIRSSLREAARLRKVTHPLARQKYLLFGGRLFLPPEDEEVGIYELDAAGQLAFAEIIKSRAEDVEFDPEGIAQRLWPNGVDSGVYMDPRITAGLPIVKGTGILTGVIYEAWRLEDESTKVVAEQYELEVEQVLDAIRFEERCRRKAA